MNASMALINGVNITSAQEQTIKRWWTDEGVSCTVTQDGKDGVVHVAGTSLEEGETGHYIDNEGFALFQTLGGGPATRCRIEDI